MHRFALAGLLPVLVAAPGAAQPSTLTEAEFLSAFGESHPAVAESFEAVALARARIVEASSFENPVLGLVREDLSGATSQVDWTLSWQLPESSRRGLIASRQEAAAAAAARHTQQRLALRLVMKKAYADWAFASARHGKLAAQAARVGKLADRQALRARRGEASGLEAHRLELAASSLRARLAQVAAGVEQARARALGWSPTLPAEAVPVLPALPVAGEVPEEHPRVHAAARELTAAKLEQEAAARLVRSPEISLGWQRQESGSQVIDGPVIGLAWSVPVFAGKRAEKAVSEARVSAAGARLARARQEVEAARRGALASFETLATALEAAEAALDSNARILAGIEAAFSQGEAGVTDLLETHRSVTESELTVLELHEAALAVHRQLELAAGAASSPSDSPHPRTETNKESSP